MQWMYSIVQITLVVSTTQIPATFSRTFSTCDDLGALLMTILMELLLLILVV